MRVDTDTTIVGAGPAGLAMGAVLRKLGVPFVILERSDRVAASWHRHYDSLHLHTAKQYSTLPFVAYPAEYPRYPSRAQFITYLDEYARRFTLEPRFGAQVLRFRNVARGWEMVTTTGVHRSRRVVVATGAYTIPHRPSWPGQDSFPGEIVHSADYSNATAFQGKRVLVVGLGSTSGEISVDLWRRGAEVAISVRSPVTIVPREVLGIPNTAFALACRSLPPKVADLLNAPTIRLTIGDLSRYGISKRNDGPFTEMYEKLHVPVVDVGVVGLIKDGSVVIRPAIREFSQDEVIFTNGEREHYDAVVLATGYVNGLPSLFEPDCPALDESGYPSQRGGISTMAGLYLCGFYNVPTGLLREIGLEAKRIGRDISRRRDKERHGD